MYRLALIGMTVWLTCLGLAGGVSNPVDSGAITLRDYVQFLEDARQFRVLVQNKQWLEADQLALKVTAYLPAFSPGYEMGFLAAAMRGDLAQVGHNLQALVQSTFLYPDSYDHFYPVLDQIPDPAFRVKVKTAVDQFFQQREVWLKAQPATGTKLLTKQVELAYLNQATGDETEVIAALSLIAPYDFDFVRVFAAGPRWRHNEKIKGILAEHQRQLAAWRGDAEQKVGGLIQVATQLRWLSASLAAAPVPDWSAQVQAYIPRILAAKSKQEYYEAMAQMVHRLGDNHTFITFPGDIADAYAGCALGITFAGGRFLVNDLADPTLREKVHPGDAITSVSGRPVMDYLAANQGRYPFVCFYDFQPRSHALAQLARHLLDGPRHTRVTVELQRPDGTRYSLTLPRETSTTAAAGSKNQAKPVEVSAVADGVHWIKLKTFADPDTYPEFTRLIGAIPTEQARGIILDLRENPGGDSGAGDAIFAHFIDEPRENYLFDFVPVFIPTKVVAYHAPIRQYAGMTTITPAVSKRFRCPVAVLTSPLTSSAAEDFAFLFKYYRRGVLVGQPTSGATGAGYHVYLPGGGRLRIAINTNLYFFEKGLAPDFAVDITPADLAAGRDPQLEKALAWLREQSQATSGSNNNF